MYATTTLGSPLFQILFFTYVGKAYTTLPERFFIVGNAVQVSAMSGIYAATTMTHGIKAAREVAAGGSISASAGLVVAELLVGLVWGTVGSALFKLFEVESRRRASLDTF